MSGPEGVPADPAPASNPEGRRRLRRLKVVAAVLLVVFLVLDLASKQWLQDELLLRPGENASVHVKDVIPGFFALQGTWNTGVTFGLAPGATLEILALTSVATLALLTWLLATRNPSRLLHVGLGLIISGALGNLHDRVKWSAVRDYFLVYLGEVEKPDWTWPNFNVADSCIVVGVGLVILEAIFGKHGAPARTPPSPAP